MKTQWNYDSTTGRNAASKLDYRHCLNCRTLFAIHPQATRNICDDCEAAVNPAFKRQLEERKSWQRDCVNGR